MIIEAWEWANKITFQLFTLIFPNWLPKERKTIYNNLGQSDGVDHRPITITYVLPYVPY